MTPTNDKAQGKGWIPTARMIEKEIRSAKRLVERKRRAHPFAVQIEALEDQLFGRTDKSGRSLLKKCVGNAFGRRQRAEATGDLSYWFMSIRKDLLSEAPPEYARQLIEHPRDTLAALSAWVKAISNVRGDSKSARKLLHRITAIEGEPFVGPIAERGDLIALLEYGGIDLPESQKKSRDVMGKRDAIRADAICAAMGDKVSDSEMEKYRARESRFVRRECAKAAGQKRGRT